MSTTTLSTLIQRLSERVEDYLSEQVTTALAASTSIVCTTLAEKTSQDDRYNRWWAYIVDENNAGEYRKVSGSTAAGTLTVLGANFTSDGADKAIFELHKYDRDNKIRAINLAARKIWPVLFKTIRDRTLTTNNILPNPSFEDWTLSTVPDYWELSNCTSAENTSGAYVMNGNSSVKVTASAAFGHLDVKSYTYPKMLDLSGKTINLYVYAYPEVADDPHISVYTVDKDGTAQTLESTTSAAAAHWTLLKLEGQTLNDDLHTCNIRLTVDTNGKYCYFDNARITGMYIHEYILPLDFQLPTTKIDNIQIQTTSAHDYYQDDLFAYAKFEPLYNWEVKDDDDGTKYLITPTLETGRHLMIEGHAPLENDLSSATDTMTVEDPNIDLLIELAASELFRLEAGLPSASDRDWLEAESYKYLASYEYMKGNLRMRKPKTYQRFDRRIL